MTATLRYLRYLLIPPKTILLTIPIPTPALRFPANRNYYKLSIPGLFRAGIDMEDSPSR